MLIYANTKINSVYTSAFLPYNGPVPYNTGINVNKFDHTLLTSRCQQASIGSQQLLPPIARSAQSWKGNRYSIGAHVALLQRIFYASIQIIIIIYALSTNSSYHSQWSDYTAINLKGPWIKSTNINYIIVVRVFILVMNQNHDIKTEVKTNQIYTSDKEIKQCNRRTLE